MTNSSLVDVFRTALRHVSSTVYAITTTHEGQRYGMIASAVSSLSFDPPSLLICVNRSASMHGVLMDASHFSVNILSRANRDVTEQFVLSGVDRFAVGDWDLVQGIPVLSDAQSSLVCKTAQRHEFGTHTILIGELVEALHRKNDLPLAYHDGRYIDISEARDIGKIGIG